MSFRLSRNVTMKVSTNFNNKVTLRAHAIIYSRLLKLQTELEIKLKELITKIIRDHPVFDGIVGGKAGIKNGLDLQAEFGLPDWMAKQAGDRILEVLQATMKIRVDYKIGTKTPVKISASGLSREEYYDKLVGQFPFEYDSTSTSQRVMSERGSFLIQWMELILNATRTVEEYIEGVGEYGINYNLGRIRADRSRSGRALMTKSTKLATRFPYTVPKHVVPRKGKDFIEEIALDIRYRRAVTNVLNKMVKDIGKPRVR